MRRSILMAALAAVVLATPAMGQEYETEEAEPFWLESGSAESVEVLLTDFDGLAGLRDHDYCAFMAQALEVDPTDDQLNGCVAAFEADEDVAWVPESFLRIISPPTTSEDDTKTSFGSGYYAVGKDIKKGTYHADAPGGCYWARLAKDGSVIEEGFTDGAESIEVTIEKKDGAFDTSDCGDWTRVKK
jgi:hypothetical protein